METIPVICIRDLDFAFDIHPVLTAVNVDIEAGDFVTFIGPNGGGKTTLLRLILGLLEPRRGEVRLFGQPPRKTRHRIGYMPQHVHLDPAFPVTVEDVVLMGRLGKRLPLGPYRAADHAVAEQALVDVELLGQRKRSFSDLSGGQRQRALIARALACQPDLLLLDEPTASLDPGIQDDLYELLQRLNQRMTVVLVSHDVSVVSRYVNKVVCVNVNVALHDSTQIKGELAKLFPGRDGLRLVQHDHDHGHDHDHHHPTGMESSP
ncbi:MAG: ABC transporter ATP-binding protein [bacterium]